MNETQQQRPTTGSDWWARRPRRSERDRKVAGVAGGLGRAFGIDPVIIRVAFVVLTIFGGVGAFGYVLGWLLLPSDSDEVSAAEALIGRGQSSVSPVLAVGLGIAALISVGTSFSWGLPFMPLVIVAGVVLVISHKRGRQQGRPASWEKHYREAEKHWEKWTGSSWGQWGGGCNRSRSAASNAAPGPATAATGPAPASPFDRPAFWDKADEQPAASPSDGPSGDDPGVRSTPPAWDPLGAAPFAWDLPEVDLTPPPPPPAKPSIIARLTLPFAFIAAGTAAAGVVYGWWDLSWGQVSGIALAVVAVGLFLSAVRGRGRNLVTPGIVLSVLTVGLSITGISGIDNYGEMDWTPTSIAEVRSDYRINAGDAGLDLRQLVIPAGEVRNVTVSVGAGNATVVVPASMNVNLTCVTTAGDTDCLGTQANGFNLSGEPLVATQIGSGETDKVKTGVLNLTVKVGAGQATVSRG